MSGDRYDVVVVGAGHGGAQAAAQLRAFGVTGPIALVGAENDPPYERPPLSKDYLLGEKTFDRMAIRAQSFWDQKDITLRLGTRVVAVDPSARRVTTHNGDAIAYDQLVWAGGGAPRRLTCPGGDLGGVHMIRTRRDVDGLKADLHAAKRAVVIGGGYIGLEAAAVLRKMNKDVTLIEAQNRVLARAAGPELGHFLEEEHRRRGVRIVLGGLVARLAGEGGRVTGVILSDGETIHADVVIVGIGIIPEVGPLIDAGAEAALGGVLIDGSCRTTLPGVYAIGDCAAHRNSFAEGAVVRIESVQNARDQATVAARVISGEDAQYTAVPWFWSDQYDIRLQTAGLAAGATETVLRGDPGSGSFSIVYLKEGRVVALDSVNAPADHMAGRKLVEQRAACDTRRLANTDEPLKLLIAG